MADQIDTIESEGRQLRQMAERDLHRLVPQYPAWTLRDLVVHTASIHARTVAVCETLPQARIPAPDLPVDRDPLEWLDENLAALIATLQHADPRAEVWFPGASRSVAAWARRMLIETGVHRWDAQQAFEDPGPLPVIVAVSGLDEFATMWLPRLGSLPTLEITASDVGRTWKYGSGEPQAVTAGTASDLYLRLMARPGANLPPDWATAVDGLATPAD